jgi:hypothetical protein
MFLPLDFSIVWHQGTPMRMGISNRALTPEVIAFFYSTIKELYSYFVTTEALEGAIGMGTEKVMHTFAYSIAVVYSVRIVHISFVLVVPVIAGKAQLTGYEFVSTALYVPVFFNLGTADFAFHSG